VDDDGKVYTAENKIHFVANSEAELLGGHSLIGVKIMPEPETERKPEPDPESEVIPEPEIVQMSSLERKQVEMKQRLCKRRHR